MPHYRHRLLPVAALASLSLLLAGCDNDGQAAAPPPGPVEVAVVTLGTRDVLLDTTLPGRTVAYRVAEVRPQAAGIIQRRLFTEGALVEAGEILYQIDPDSYRAALARAEAAVAQARAQEGIARLRAERLAGLVERKLVSQQDYDDAAAALAAASAAVAVAVAERDLARIDLGYTGIRAPIAGRIGRSLVTEGALVEAEQEQPLAVIQQIDPVYVDITQSSVELTRLKQALAAGDLLPAGDNAAAVRLRLEDGSEYPHPGTLEFSEVRVDESTGNVVIRATVPNPDQLLLPGMFVRASLDQALRRAAVLAPQQAITFDYSGKPYAMLVKEDATVEQRFIEVGRTVGDQWLVLSGLGAGDRVVVEGLQKIRPGAQVTAVPAQEKVAPEAH
ncbi:MAG: efflux RND transporter periplasmic adaptor subunit [Pseudomonadota bacterium]